MALVEFKNKPDTTTPINATNLNNNFNYLNEQLSDIYNLIYPIGSIIIKSDNKDYSNYLGFTWERTLLGRVPVGIDSDDTDFNTIGKTGGEKTHTLVRGELPAQAYELYQSDGQSTTQSQSVDALNNISIWTNNYRSIVNNLNNNGGQSHNNLQPYEVVAFWKRIA